MKNEVFRFFIRVILFPFSLFFMAGIYFYKLFISPLLPRACIYTPTCSTYALQAIKQHGPIRGAYLGAKRILRCNPFQKGGHDPVPHNIKGEFKWLI